MNWTLPTGLTTKDNTWMNWTIPTGLTTKDKT